MPLEGRHRRSWNGGARGRPADQLGGPLALVHQQLVHALGGRALLVGDDLAVGEHDRTIGIGCGDGVMGDHDDGLPKFLDGSLQEAQHFGAGDGIEVAGGLVGEHQRRFGDERTRDGDALLLAARQFIRPVRETFLESQRRRQHVEPLTVGLLTRQSQRHEDVLLGGEHRQQVEALEDEADLVAAQHGQLIVVHGGDVGTVEHDMTARGRVESGERVHERGLAGAGRAHDRGEPPLLEPHIDAAQRMHRVFAMPVVLDQVDRLDGDGVPLFLRRTGIGLRLHDLLFHNVLFHINTGIFPERYFHHTDGGLGPASCGGVNRHRAHHP